MKTFSAAAIALLAGSAYAQVSEWGQCGGINYTGSKTCNAGLTCVYINDYYYQCQKGSNPPTTTAKPASTSTKPASTTTSKPATSSGKVKYAGVNVAGFDFGCAIDGSQNLNSVLPPLLNHGGNDGPGQMQHFVKDDGLNIFRLPVGWQWLVNNNLGGTIDWSSGGHGGWYDELVQACLKTGAKCIVDIHNYARWNGQIIGQGGPSNAQFASLWTQIATKYKGNTNVVFGLMNEPHDVPNIQTWAQTVQYVVTAIRNTVGNTGHMILMPGNNWTSAQAMPTGAGPYLLGVKNPDGSTTNLIFDVHKYLDGDNSGTNAECVTDNVNTGVGAGTFPNLVSWLRANKRQALLTESGGGNTQSCVNYLCSQYKYFNANSDVLLGWVGWSAGAFLPSWNYVLTEVPTNNGGVWTDTLLTKQCVVGMWKA